MSDPPPRLRSVTTLLGKVRKRVAAQGLRRAASYWAFTAALERTGLEVIRVFAWGPAAGSGTIAAVDRMAALSAADVATLGEYGGDTLLRLFTEAFVRGDRCAIGRVDGKLACVCWIVRIEGHQAAGAPAVLVERCFTLPAFRGRSLYPDTLRGACDALRREHGAALPILIESSIWNDSSIRGIEKAGFHPVGTLYKLRSWEHFRPAR
ncbi:MAG: hypothetical protein EXR72_11815 [Myxococcales bacterium]|nr:hypothetical protein [Myxococcales bacterium]